MSMSGRFRPPQEEEDEEEAAEGEQDAEDVDTVCRSIRPTISQEARATAAGPRTRRPQPQDGEKGRNLLEKTRRGSGTRAGVGGGGEGWRDLLGFIVDSAGLVAMCV